MCEIETEQGWNALPFRWHVHALQTSRPHPYFGPVMPSRSRSTHRTRSSSPQLTVTDLPLRMKLCCGTGPPYGRLSVGDAGIGGTVGYGVKPSGWSWLMGNFSG